MLDTIKMGMLRLDTKNQAHGYLRVTYKDGRVKSYFKVPLHVVFDKIGYNSYKEYLHKKNPELKTWVKDTSIIIPPDMANIRFYAKHTAHEWFLGNLRDLTQKYPNFPSSLKTYIQDSITKYLKKKQKFTAQKAIFKDYEEDMPVNEAELFCAQKAVEIYTKLQRSRFDSGLANKSNNSFIEPFCRTKGDKSAKQIIEKVTNAVADYILANPKVSKFTETEGSGLKIKLTSMFMECVYKEHLNFMKRKLEQNL